MPRNYIIKYRKKLLNKIQYAGIVIAFKYIYYQKSDYQYKKSEYSLSCLFYLRLLLKCNIEPFSRFDFTKINKERARLKTEVFKILEIISTATAKLIRLFKQQDFLASRETEIIRRGLENVNKLKKLKT